MQISVIIPAYNAERFIAQAIESVIAQTMTDWELIIINDGSTDNTQNISQEYALRDERIRIITQKNAGVSAARNRGLKEANQKVEYISFLDADDYLAVHALSSLLSALITNPDASGAYGMGSRVDVSGNLLPGWESYYTERFKVVDEKVIPIRLDQPTSFSVLVYGNCISSCAILLRKKVSDAVGLFSTTLSHSEDYDYWIRMSLHGCWVFIPDILFFYRYHNTNASNDIRKIVRGDYAVRSQLLHAKELNAVQKREVRSAWLLWKLKWYHFEISKLKEDLKLRNYTNANKRLLVLARSSLGIICLRFRP